MVKKVIMAVTGIIMIGFLLMHMYGNLKMFQGPESFDGYAHWLKGDILYPIVPKGVFIWIFRFGLTASVILHIWAAVSLSRNTLKVRGSGYQKFRPQAQTYSARTMRWGGVIVAGFIIFHLLQFTVKVITPGFDPNAGPFEMFLLTFQQWWMVVLYAVLMVVICMHVRHGFWSAFVTLGANSSPRSGKILNWLGIGVAVALFIGFMLPPVAVLLGWITN
ncbi:succinate dehydrogenase cytochrome b subunit [Tessaracoccus rhinocerotis]|uniref:Succinate dehydrogenase cytochrome b subunit n=1 Tax=Tessaracoccus rhinocerotis TaxID=1689449 RepID=A0A553K363_9ACTN|nr:succinate dehydrogenase cytochrome b subunit [Tessaracoccus rhinocerotis]